MPRLRRRYKSRRVVSLGAVYALASGHYFGFLDLGPRLTPDELYMLWQQIGPELTSLHIVQYPGSRPWGFWRFDAVFTAEEEDDFDESPGQQAAYLDAHGLLSAQEVHALARKAPDAETEYRPALSPDQLTQWLGGK